MKLKYLIKNIEIELRNITSEVIIKHELSEAEVLADIAAETNEVVETYSRNMALEDEDNQRTDEDLDKHRKCELNTAILEGDKKCEDSVSNGLTSRKISHGLTSGDVSFELNRFESSPHQTGSSSSSAASQSSFVVLEPDSSLNEEFEFDDLKEESNLSLKEFGNKIISQDTVDEKRSAAVAKDFDNSENEMREQDSSLFIKEEIRDLKKTLGKCFSYLGKLETIALKRDNSLNKLHLEEGIEFPKSDENNVKTIMMRKTESDLTLSLSNSLKNNINTCANKKKSLQELQVHFNDYRNGCMKSSNRERYVCDRSNGRCFDSNPFAIEWGLDTYVIKEDGNCSIQTSKSDATENHPLHSHVASPQKTDMVEKDWNEEYCSKNNKKSNLSAEKVVEKKPFKSCKPLFANIDENKKLWEYYRNILYRQQQYISDLTYSTAAKNQPSDEASPKKFNTVENERNEITKLVLMWFDITEEIEKQRIIINRRRRQEELLVFCCLMLLLIYFLFAVSHDLICLIYQSE